LTVTFQKLITETFYQFMGVSRLAYKSDFPVIDDSTDLDDLPFLLGDTEKKVRQERFYWEGSKAKATNPHNAAALARIAAYARTFGARPGSETAGKLELIEPADWKAAFVTKYNALKKAYNKDESKGGTAPGGEQTASKMRNRKKWVSGGHG